MACAGSRPATSAIFIKAIYILSKCIIDSKSDEEIITAYNQATSFIDFLRKLGHKISYNTRVCSDTKNKVTKVCNALNLDLNKFKVNNVSSKKFCVVCGKKLTSDNKTGYCIDCLYQTRINNWLNGEQLKIKPTSTFPSLFRSYIFKEQEGKCAICGLSDSWNGKPLKFVLDHIDGDASNNCRNNLRLVCPNCDSQLDTFKSKNKKSARRVLRHKYY